MPELVSCIDECRALGDTGIVNKNVCVAETFSHTGKHSRDAFRIGHVTDQPDRLVADLGGNLLDLFSSPGSDGYSRAVACEAQCNGATNTPAAARYQRNFSIQHLSVLSV